MLLRLRGSVVFHVKHSSPSCVVVPQARREGGRCHAEMFHVKHAERLVSRCEIRQSVQVHIRVNVHRHPSTYL